jgi:hypothetical protein
MHYGAYNATPRSLSRDFCEAARATLMRIEASKLASVDASAAAPREGESSREARPAENNEACGLHAMKENGSIMSDDDKKDDAAPKPLLSPTPQQPPPNRFRDHDYGRSEVPAGVQTWKPKKGNGS